MKALLIVVFATLLSACATSAPEVSPSVTLNMTAAKATPGFVEMMDPGTKQTLFVAQKPAIGADEVESLKDGFSQDGMPVLYLKLKSSAVKRFKEMTNEQIGKPLAMLVNGRLVTAPVLRGAISNGMMVISGSWSAGEVRRIAHPQPNAQ
jgi:preprotein translocase subunit SecD